MEPYFSTNGIEVHLPDPEKDVDFHERGGGEEDLSRFEGRQPVLYDDKKRKAYIGAPNWYHADAYAHHNNGRNYDDNIDEGYFNGGSQWGDGHLLWYGEEPADHPHIAQAISEATGAQIGNPEARIVSQEMPEEAWNDEDWDDISGLHHPRDVDSWQ